MKKKRYTIVLNGFTLNVELGHSREEWETLACHNDSLWDISLEDLIDGSIDGNSEIVYWLIGGRLCETDELIG